MIEKKKRAHISFCVYSYELLLLKPSNYFFRVIISRVYITNMRKTIYPANVDKKHFMK